MPILYFGNYNAYLKSVPKIVTVALNPSGVEFPIDSPNKRFANGPRSGYLNDLNQYFATNAYEPYTDWFDFFEQALNGMGASYFEKPGYPLRALHTDICTPIATAPTWNDLGKKKSDPNHTINKVLKRQMEAEGVKLWHQLIDVLQPDIIIISTAKRYLSKIKFEGPRSLNVLCTYTETKDGGQRKSPYVVRYRKVKLSSGQPAMLVFAPGGVKPLAPISHVLKHEVGQRVVKEFRQNLSLAKGDSFS